MYYCNKSTEWILLVIFFCAAVVMSSTTILVVARYERANEIMVQLTSICVSNAARATECVLVITIDRWKNNEVTQGMDDERRWCDAHQCTWKLTFSENINTKNWHEQIMGCV